MSMLRTCTTAALALSLLLPGVALAGAAPNGELHHLDPLDEQYWVWEFGETSSTEQTTDDPEAPPDESDDLDTFSSDDDADGVGDGDDVTTGAGGEEREGHPEEEEEELTPDERISNSLFELNRFLMKWLFHQLWGRVR